LSDDHIQAVVNEDGQVKIVAKQEIPEKFPLVRVPRTLALTTASVSCARELVVEYQAIDKWIRAYTGKRHEASYEGDTPIGRGGIVTKDVDR